MIIQVHLTEESLINLKELAKRILDKSECDNISHEEADILCESLLSGNHNEFLCYGCGKIKCKNRKQ